MNGRGLKAQVAEYLNANPAATRAQIVMATGLTGKQVDNVLFRIGSGWVKREWAPKVRYESVTLQSIWR